MVLKFKGTMPVSAESDASDLGRASWYKNTMGKKTQVKLGSQGPGRDQYCSSYNHPV